MLALRRRRDRCGPRYTRPSAECSSHLPSHLACSPANHALGVYLLDRLRSYYSAAPGTEREWVSVVQNVSSSLRRVPHAGLSLLPRRPQILYQRRAEGYEETTASLETKRTLTECRRLVPGMARLHAKPLSVSRHPSIRART